MNKILFSVMITSIAGMAYTQVSAQAGEGLSFNRQIDKVVNAKVLPPHPVIPEASGQQWSDSGDGAMKRFMVDSIVWRAFYNKKGNLLLTVKYYDERKLPADIRAMVKSHYYDDRILTVEEIMASEKIQYRIDMEGTRTRKTIIVFDGEMELLNEFDILP
ncbi:hypothetical protein ACX0G9_06750 [Flavitalea flava]